MLPTFWGGDDEGVVVGLLGDFSLDVSYHTAPDADDNILRRQAVQDTMPSMRLAGAAPLAEQLIEFHLTLLAS